MHTVWVAATKTLTKANGGGLKAKSDNVLDDLYSEAAVVSKRIVVDIMQDDGDLLVDNGGHVTGEEEESGGLTLAVTETIANQYNVITTKN